MLYSFTGGNDGRQPSHGVVFGLDGALYGTLLQTRRLRHGIRANAAGKARWRLEQNGALQFSGNIHRRPVP